MLEGKIKIFCYYVLFYVEMEKKIRELSRVDCVCITQRVSILNL